MQIIPCYDRLIRRVFRRNPYKKREFGCVCRGAGPADPVRCGLNSPGLTTSPREVQSTLRSTFELTGDGRKRDQSTAKIRTKPAIPILRENPAQEPSKSKLAEDGEKERQRQADGPPWHVADSRRDRGPQAFAHVDNRIEQNPELKPANTT
jgi:hypothetical protein